MFSNHFKQNHFIRVCILAAIFMVFIVMAPSVSAGDYSLDWSQIGFVEGTSSLQTYLNVESSGVDMTTEVRVLNSAFQDVGIYIPDTTPLNLNMPRPDGPALAVRDINPTNYPGPTMGYILTKVTFSPSVFIDSLWLESFFNWTGGNVRKHMALQAFDEYGNGLIPVNWQTYGGSSLIVEPHPDNGEPWLRSSYPDTQTTFSGGSNITYGTQAVSELHWYSWGLLPSGDFSQYLGSSDLGDFQFTPETPTAINLVSAGVAEGETQTLALILLAILVTGLVTLIILQKQHLKKT